MASNLSQISRYVLLSDAAYADFVSKNTGLPFNTETDKSDIAKALAARLSSQGKGKGDVANADAAQVQLVVQNLHPCHAPAGYEERFQRDAVSGQQS